MKRVPTVAMLLLLGACTSSAEPVTLQPTSTTSPAISETAPVAVSSSTTTVDSIDPGECGQIGPVRWETGAGPVFVCERPGDGGAVYGGQAVSRPGVTTAEEAVRVWLAGPTKEEQAAGLQGWDLRPYPWFTDSLAFHREDGTLVMEVTQWEPIDNLSTSTGSAVFLISLFGTVFSDPTVEQLELSILGETCPVMIGESEWCFPIDWDDFVASFG